MKVWLDSGGGPSPVVLWTVHTPAGTVTEQKMCESEWTTGPCGKYYSIYGCGRVWVWSYHAPDSHTVVHVNDWNANYIGTGEGVNKLQYV